MNTWQRARKPEQKLQRRNDLIAAAAKLFGAGEYESISIGEIAQEAGMAASNVYLYFGSKEELFLAVYEADMNEWIVAIEAELPEETASPLDVAGILAKSVSSRPRLAALSTLLTVVVGRNISNDALAAFNKSVILVNARTANAVQKALPTLGLEAAQKISVYLFAVVAGLWPMANPAPTLTELLQTSSFAHLHISFEKDLGELLHALLIGLVKREQDPTRQ